MDLSGRKEHVLDVGAHWRNLVNMIEVSVCGGDAAVMSSYFHKWLARPCVAMCDMVVMTGYERSVHWSVST